MRALCGKAERRATKVADQIAYNEEFHRIVVDAADSPRLDLGDARGGRHPARVPDGVLGQRRAARAVAVLPPRAGVRADAKQPELAEAVMRMHILGARDFLWRVIHG